LTPVAFLFDTDAVSELLRPKPAKQYVEWVRTVAREDQHISAITVGELYHGAFRSQATVRHIENIEARLLPAVTILPYDQAVAKVFGRIRAALEAAGTRLDDADLQIAATAIYHGLELVTGNIRHFSRISELHVNHAFADTRR
jgi:predicted nucleic acid-binding protein